MAVGFCYNFQRLPVAVVLLEMEMVTGELLVVLLKATKKRHERDQARIQACLPLQLSGR